MKRIYLSHFLGMATPFYGGDGSFQADTLRSMAAGDSCNASRWSFPNHAGTHVDLPRHFITDGMSMDDYPPDFWFFQNVEVIDISAALPCKAISPEMLEEFEVSPDIELLLLKTGSGRFRATPVYWQEGPVFRPELADHLRSRFSSLRAFGFDTISVSSWTDRPTGREAHRAFLGGDKPILLIEDMNLEEIEATRKISSVTVAPLLVKGADAAPCTVIAEVIK